ncbi:Piwi domain-containing protein [Porticoccaceae bacterium]|nr:Piwi domain-containing protein [Porticoccaceae bacterium]
MDDIQLNYFPLKVQNQSFSIFRKRVEDGSHARSEGDYRVNLPVTPEDEEWKLYDVSLHDKEGYESLDCDYLLNYVLTLHVIYCQLLQKLESLDDIDYYLPEYNAISRKEIYFRHEKYNEGFSEIVVSPYFLKEKGLYGFLFEHRFSLKEGKPFNRNTQKLSFSLDKSGRPNVYFYKDKKSEISDFIENTFSKLVADADLVVDEDFCWVDTDNLDIKTYLVGKGKEARSQFMGIKSNGPYRPIDENVRYLFVFSERTRALARDIYLGLVGKLFPGQFPGLGSMFSLPIDKGVVDHHLVADFDKPSLDGLNEKIIELKSSYPEHKIIMIPVLPKGFKGVDAAFDAYGNLKLMALKEEVCCQVVTEDTFYKKDQLKWSISNIGLQVFSKLGGAPWLVRPAKSGCLIFGLGTVQERTGRTINKYTAYTVCLDSSGDFKYIKPLASSGVEASYLDNLKASLKDVLSSELGDQYNSIVLHLPYKISRKEISVIRSVVWEIRDDNFEVVVIRINTKHKFLGFSSHNTCVPYESSFTQLSKTEFLLWAEGLQYGKEVLHKRVSEPLYIEFLESQESWDTKRDCLQDILNLTGANWRGFNSKAQPISILYSRLIAKFMKEFSHLESVNDMDIVSAESVAPWFL